MQYDILFEYKASVGITAKSSYIFPSKNFIPFFLKIFEFIIFEYEDKEYDGIIDLLLEYEDKMVIIDYKLSNIDDENYVKQLSIYKSFIENKTKKETETYLYSILNDTLKKI